jgi:hypothetical protein
MEPLNEKELDQLLRRWEAPPAPSTLKGRVFPAPIRWWKWLWAGSIRVPVPVVVMALLLIAFWIQSSRQVDLPQTAQPGTVSLKDFQPVPQLQPVLVSGERK